MKSLRKLFGKEANPMAEKLEKLINEDLVNIFYSFGFVFTDENLLKFRKNLDSNSLEKVRSELKFDVMQDNVEVFFTTSSEGRKYMCLIVDYFEPLRKEDLLEQLWIKEFPNVKMEKVK